MPDEGPIRYRARDARSAIVLEKHHFEESEVARFEIGGILSGYKTEVNEPSAISIGGPIGGVGRDDR